MRGVSESARHLRGVKHPHIVSVLSVERIGVGWSIVTEHVDGVPLDDVFFSMSLGARLRAVVDVLTALSALHVPMAKAGAPLEGRLRPDTPKGLTVVHGGCLRRASFVERTGRTKLGFAYRGVLGMRKDTYAPEALLGDAMDARTDVYGAGVLVWEAVTGRSLFGADSPEEVVKKQLSGRVDKALPASRDRWARALLPVIDRALATDPKSRYATIAEMAAALRIAVRARLVFHDDIVEELWPAQTTPTIASGVQPSAQPVPAALESQTRIVQARTVDGSAGTVEIAPAELLAPPPAPIASPLEPVRPFVPPLVMAVVAIFVVVLAIVIACVVHIRGRTLQAPTVDVPTLQDVGAEVALPAPTPRNDMTATGAIETSAPVTAPPPREVAPHKVVRHPTKPQATFDPSSI
jgi:hypothetical protein